MACSKFSLSLNLLLISGASLLFILLCPSFSLADSVPEKYIVQLTPEEEEQLYQKISTLVEKAVELYQSGKKQESLATLTQALELAENFANNSQKAERIGYILSQMAEMGEPILSLEKLQIKIQTSASSP